MYKQEKCKKTNGGGNKKRKTSKYKLGRILINWYYIMDYNPIGSFEIYTKNTCFTFTITSCVHPSF